MSTTQNVSSPLSLKGAWKENAKKLQAKFPKLTDADLEFGDGREEDLLKRIEVRLELKRDEVLKILKQTQN